MLFSFQTKFFQLQLLIQLFSPGFKQCHHTLQTFKISGIYNKVGESETHRSTKQHCLKYISPVSNLAFTGGLVKEFYIISIQYGSTVNEDRYQIQGQRIAK